MRSSRKREKPEDIYPMIFLALSGFTIVSAPKSIPPLVGGIVFFLFLLCGRWIMLEASHRDHCKFSAISNYMLVGYGAIPMLLALIGLQFDLPVTKTWLLAVGVYLSVSLLFLVAIKRMPQSIFIKLKLPTCKCHHNSQSSSEGVTHSSN